MTYETMRQRTARREIVNEFLADRDYWRLMKYLSSGLNPPFMCLDEAVTTFRMLRRFSRKSTEDLRTRYVVARFFVWQGRNWL